MTAKSRQPEVLCPFCDKAIAAGKIHQDDNYAFCPSCQDGFRIVDEWQTKFSQDKTALPPEPIEGFSFKVQHRGFSLFFKKASPMGLILMIFSLPFILMPISLLIYPQFYEGLSIGKTILALPFILCGLLALWIGAVKLLGSHTIIVKPSGEGIFVTQVGPIKTRQKFNWNDVKSVRVSWTRFTGANSSTAQITPEVILVGRKKFSLPVYFSREECQYIAMFLSEQLKG